MADAPADCSLSVTRRWRWLPTSRIFLIGASTFLLGLSSSVVRAVVLHPEWAATTSYTGGAIYAGSCVTANGYIYCVGGTQNDQILYAPVSSMGIGTWRQATPYGEGGTNRFLSCAIEGGYIYCVGGLNRLGASNDVTSDVWFAPLVSDGIGAWQQTLAYGVPALRSTTGKIAGVPIWAHSCVTHAGYIYCIAGLERTYQLVGGGSASSSEIELFDRPTTRVLYAPVSSAGVGEWRAASNYGEPVSGHSCVAADGYIYCVGGRTGNGSSISDSAHIWYSQILSDHALGPWTLTSSYGGGPVEGLSCAAVSGQIYCVGGSTNQVWSAPVSPSGIGGWTRQPDYPGGNWKTSCVSVTGDLFCVGGTAGEARHGTSSAFYSAIRSYSETATLQTADSCRAFGADWDPDSGACTFRAWDEGASAGAEELGSNDGAFANDWNPASTDRTANTAVVHKNLVGRISPFPAGSFDKRRIFDDAGTILVSSGRRDGRFNEECSPPPSAVITSPAACRTTSVTITVDPPSAAYESDVSVTATVSDTSESPTRLTGAVLFSDNGAGGTFSSGTCRPEHDALICSTPYTAPNFGTQLTITAAHHDALHARGLGSTRLTLTGSPPKITVTSSANPSVAGHGISFTSTIWPFDGGGGTVTFTIDGTALITANPRAAADSAASTGSISSLSVGIHTVTASFSGGVSLDDNIRLLAPGAGGVIQRVVGELKDQSSCEDLGGSWISGGRTCTVSSLRVDQSNSFQVDHGITLANTDGTITIESGGMIINRGTIASSGLQDGVDASAITIKPEGSMANFGTLSNLGGVFIHEGATLTNVGLLENGCGATTTGTVSGAPAVNRCDAIAAWLSP